MHKLLVSPSPHIHSGDTIERNMYDVIIALIPAFGVSIYFFGLDALWVTLTSILACTLFEWVISRFLLGRKEITVLDGSAVLTGLLLALNLPSTLPLWIVVVGALVAIGIGKMSFGGLGNNIFNPAIVGRVMLLISFPVQMTSYPSPLGEKLVSAGTEAASGASPLLDATSGATPLAIAKGITKGAEGFTMDKLPELTDNLLGMVGGSMGEVSAIALLIGFAYLLIRKVITWHIPVAIIATVAIFAGIMNGVSPDVYAGPLFHILSGGLLLGAIYMATDYVTSPMSKSGMLLYGIMIGIITMLIRLFGSYPEGMSFAILFMNGIVPIINRYMQPKLFGKSKKA
ncbi:RnfABCDGE type electron transport complex subunit D [Porphyromonas levii]|nr:RnfABCDGE type electron transport complex subunit D [Porphyromonas levii]MBR8702762.1 Proton-translocating ferredoxin:NAD(+) oxidoreductase complex subunit D [Porphyromonas levii]MBR8715370.1 Proton-translocating ferredoxin:NAD(+) oxidoreductase complex subunit D [Porphyromonas levii]MBR8727906.1 Proton-translocating ferredoxin:NAD(+) oxidoreductase complex subunit D [Porphyromonas levii]MBR8729920.1 Proton-translocating ferredoxin:NAD(+) oxidoreductase complex subunit D [Porphyromonas levii